MHRAGSTPLCSAVPGRCVSCAVWSLGTVPCDTPSIPSTADPSLPADWPLSASTPPLSVSSSNQR